MKLLLLAATAAITLLIASVAAGDPLMPCQCSLSTPTWNVSLKQVAYPPRFLIYETPASTPTDLNPDLISVGEMWDKSAAARATYSPDMYAALLAFQSWYAFTPSATTPLNAFQVAGLTAQKAVVDALVAKIKALAAKP